MSEHIKHISRREFLKRGLIFTGVVSGAGSFALTAQTLVDHLSTDERVQKEHPRPTEEELTRAKASNLGMRGNSDQIIELKRAESVFRRERDYQKAMVEEYSRYTRNYAISAGALGISFLSLVIRYSSKIRSVF